MNFIKKTNDCIIVHHLRVNSKSTAVLLLLFYLADVFIQVQSLSFKMHVLNTCSSDELDNLAKCV